MMKISIGWKLGLTYLLLIAVAMVALGTFIVEDFQTNYLNAFRDNLLRYGNVIANKSAPFLREGTNLDYLDFVVRDYSEQMGNRVIIVNAANQVIADSAREIIGDRLQTPEVAEALKGRTASNAYDTQQYGLVLYMAVPIVSGKQNLGAVFIAAHINHLAQQIANLKERLFIFSLTTGLAIFALSILMARMITTPLQQLYQGVQKISQGKYGTQLNVVGKNEFAALGEAFNLMSSRIATEDKIRRQFVANASHELKSPLASMKALVEASQKSKLSELEVREVLVDINQEVDRLDKLVGDLLLLSKIENNRQVLQLQEVSVGELVYQVVKKLEPLAKQKDIILQVATDENVYWFMDGQMIFRALFNLVDNAIKYSSANGIVTIGYQEKEQQMEIWVKDEGAGIEEQEQQEIFQRFYRLDKARSRETGGSGLGLAIVGEIISIHHGQIKVNSTAGKGSTFTMILQKIYSD